MEIMQYTLTSIATILGIGIGAMISNYTKHEQKTARQYFRKIVLPVSQEKVFGVLGILYAFASFTQYFLLFATLLLFYSIPVGSHLFADNRKRELFFAPLFFVITAVICRIALAI